MAKWRPSPRLSKSQHRRWTSSSGLSELIERLSFVAEGKHTAYLSWIEDGPMGMAIGSYMPGPDPVKIAFEGYVTVAEGELGVLLPYDALVEDPEFQFRELQGLFIASVEPVDTSNCSLPWRRRMPNRCWSNEPLSWWKTWSSTTENDGLRRLGERRELAKFSDADAQKAGPNRAGTPVEKDLRTAAPAAPQIPQAPQVPGTMKVDAEPDRSQQTAELLGSTSQPKEPPELLSRVRESKRTGGRQYPPEEDMLQMVLCFEEVRGEESQKKYTEKFNKSITTFKRWRNELEARGLVTVAVNGVTRPVIGVDYDPERDCPK